MAKLLSFVCFNLRNSEQKTSSPLLQESPGGIVLTDVLKNGTTVTRIYGG